MKFTFCVTQQCNLACDYCYIGKNRETMSLDIAQRVVDFAFRQTPAEERLEIGFFGGEPLLAFDRIRDITALFEEHPEFSKKRVEMTVVSNGTVFNQHIVDFLLAHDISLGISCDGPPDVHDHFRRFHNGKGSSLQVEKTLRQMVDCLPQPMVNAVYHPSTFQELPRVVRYFSQLGLRHIYLNPDFSAPWKSENAAQLPALYATIGDFHMDAFTAEDPHFISFLDVKLGLIYRGGYSPKERCRMGRGEYAFSSSGYIYPCERLLGDGEGGGHCIGHVTSGLTPSKIGCHSSTGIDSPAPCRECGIRDYCMNWCGCSNYMSTGSYNTPGAFLCASERGAITTAMQNIERLEAAGQGSRLFAHLFGPAAGSIQE